MNNNLNGSTNSSQVVNNNLNANNNTGQVVNNGQNISNLNNTSSKSNNSIYIWISVIVGFVLIVAIILLVLLLNGTIMNRNKLTCTRSSEEGLYTLDIKKIYRFDKGEFYRVDEFRTLTYHSNLTDEAYELEFSDLINNPTGVSQYGFNTKISKEGNVVNISYYNPKILDQSYDNIKTTNESDGFVCN